MRFWEWGQGDLEWPEQVWESLTQIASRGPWGQTYDQEFNPTSGTDYITMGHNSGQFNVEVIHRCPIAAFRQKLGQVPVLIQAQLVLTGVSIDGTTAGQWYCRRFLHDWDTADYTSWFQDDSASEPWYGDKKHLVRGYDVSLDAVHISAYSHTSGLDDKMYLLCTDIVARALRDNDEIRMCLGVNYSPGSLPPGDIIFYDHSDTSAKRQYYSFVYLYPVEFYKDDGAGDLDLASVIGDVPGEEYYLGAVGPNETSTAVKGHLKNYSGSQQQVELFDDHPEYSTPITRVGTSTLDYVVLSEPATSQKYTVVFYSNTEYEIVAETYRDNAVSYHPAINADATWRGTVSTNFTAPEGGLSIPAAAWQTGTATGDEYEIACTGNTTDTAWPADSNDQVEITRDNAGSADATGWRPIQGHRELTKGSITVDATTKFFPTRRINPVDWPVDNRAFVHNLASINEGQIDSVQEASIGSTSFSGTGNDDITISGNYNGIWTNTLRVKIDGTGSPNTFTWSIDGGSTWEATAVPCTLAGTELVDGLIISFAATTGHVLDDYWDADIETWGITLKSLTANSNVYGGGSIIGTSLPIRDVDAAIFTTVNAASGVSESNPARLYIDDTAGFSASQDVFVQTPLSPSTGETLEVQTVGSGYIDFTSAMTQDYIDGDFVTVVGVGEAAFWMRAVTTPTTAEQLKRLRLNARLL